nr:amyloid-beta A4 precursor protein-binding family B member 2-like [Salvelinus alpinus]XP_023845535.1 amyloid-beta A4 precursor protein-binding family B member 2-like [Salvelinus alpinus]
MMSVHTPPLSRSGSSPSSVGLANRSGPPAAPPTSLSLRSSYNQLLGHDIIKESPTAMETGSSATLPKSRHRYAMTSVHSAMGLSGRRLPTKSSSSSALYSSSSSSFFSTNPKLAKDGANLQRKAETQQQEQSKTNTEVKEQDDIITPIRSSDWMESENSQDPLPFCRRTKSFLEFHEKEEDPPSGGNKEEDSPSGGNKEEDLLSKEEEEGDEKHPCPEKDQVSLDKERERPEEEKQTPKQEEYKEEEGATPTAAQPLLLHRVHSPAISPLNHLSWAQENKIQSCPTLQGREEALTQAQGHPHSVETPPKPPRSAQAPPPRVIKVELHPNNENPYLHRPPSAPHKQPRGEESTPLLLQTPPSSFSPDPERGASKLGSLGTKVESPLEDEDSSWTTLSQESPSPQTPQEIADVWVRGTFPQAGVRSQTYRRSTSACPYWHTSTTALSPPPRTHTPPPTP